MWAEASSSNSPCGVVWSSITGLCTGMSAAAHCAHRSASSLAVCLSDLRGYRRRSKVLRCWVRARFAWANRADSKNLGSLAAIERRRFYGGYFRVVPGTLAVGSLIVLAVVLPRETVSAARRLCRRAARVRGLREAAPVALGALPTVRHTAGHGGVCAAAAAGVTVRPLADFSVFVRDFPCIRRRHPRGCRALSPPGYGQSKRLVRISNGDMLRPGGRRLVASCSPCRVMDDDQR